MEFVGNDTRGNYYGRQVKVIELQIKLVNKELLKLISTRHLLNQQCILVVTHIRILVLYCQKI